MSKRKTGGRYARLLGSFWRSDKAQRLSPDAFRLYVNALSYCADSFTDGHIPSYMPSALLRAHADGAVAELTARDEDGCAFWYAVEGGFQVHDYLEVNDSKAEIEARRRAGRRAAKARWSSGDPPATDPPGGGSHDADRTAMCSAKPEGQKVRRQNSPPPLPPAPGGSAESGGEVESGADSSGGGGSGGGGEGVYWLVARGYQRRYEREAQSAWQSYAANEPQLREVSAWVAAEADRHEVDPTRVVDRMLDGFFADEWARDHDWPLRRLAKDPARYARSRGAA